MSKKPKWFTDIPKNALTIYELHKQCDDLIAAGFRDVPVMINNYDTGLDTCGGLTINAERSERAYVFATVN